MVRKPPRSSFVSHNTPACVGKKTEMAFSKLSKVLFLMLVCQHDINLIIVTNRHRVQDEIDTVRDVNLAELRDPAKDEERVLEDNWLVLIGICTHLGK